jgi:hypothetical protein
MKSLHNIFRTISQEKMFPNTKFMMLSLSYRNKHAQGLKNIAEICQEMNIDIRSINSKKNIFDLSIPNIPQEKYELITKKLNEEGI